MSTEADKPNTAALATICAVLFLSMLGITLAVMALVRTSEQEDVSKKSISARAPFEELASSQKSELTKGFEWANRDAGTATVPIDRAMAIVLKNIQADPESATATAPPVADAGADGAAEQATGDAGETADGGAAAGDAATADESDAGAQAPKPGETAGEGAAPVLEAPKGKIKAPKTPKVGPGGKRQPATPEPPTEPGGAP